MRKRWGEILGCAPLARVPDWHSIVGPRAELTPLAYPLFATADVRAVREGADRVLRDARSRGLIVTVARGLHVAVPLDAGPEWRPRVVEVAWLIAVARHGRHPAPPAAPPYLCGITAASLHRAANAVPGIVHVTVPRQTRSLELPALRASVVFHQRFERCLGSPWWYSQVPDREDAGPELEDLPGQLCRPLMTSRNQTALDLLHSPARMDVWGETRPIVRRLLLGGDYRAFLAVAKNQRRHSAAERRSYERPWPHAWFTA